MDKDYVISDKYLTHAKALKGKMFAQHENKYCYADGYIDDICGLPSMNCRGEYITMFFGADTFMETLSETTTGLIDTKYSKN